MTKRYEYVSLSYDGHFITGTMTEHRQIIDEYAEKGYRYVGMIPTELTAHGYIRAIDLVFEMEE